MNRVDRIVRAHWFPYVTPFVTFMALSYVGGFWPGAAHLWYAAKTVVVGAMLVAFRRRYPELGWGGSLANWVIGVAAGVLALIIWVAPEDLLAPLMFRRAGCKVTACFARVHRRGPLQHWVTSAPATTSTKAEMLPEGPLLGLEHVKPEPQIGHPVGEDAGE